MQRSGRPAACTCRPSASSTIEQTSATRARGVDRAGRPRRIRAVRIVEPPGVPGPDADDGPGQVVEHGDGPGEVRVAAERDRRLRAVDEQRNVEREDRAGGPLGDAPDELERVHVQLQASARCRRAGRRCTRAAGAGGRPSRAACDPTRSRGRRPPRACRRAARRRRGPSWASRNSSGPSMVRTTTAPRIPWRRASSSERASVDLGERVDLDPDDPVAQGGHRAGGRP